MQDGSDAPLPCHRLEGFEALEGVTDPYQQRPQQSGLLRPGPASDPNQAAQEEQAGEGDEEAPESGLPRHHTRKGRIERDLEQKRDQGRDVQVGVAGPLGLGREGVGDGTNRLVDVVAPARRHEGIEQPNAQVGCHPGHRVADLSLRKERQDRLQPHRAHDRGEERLQGELDTEGCVEGKDLLLETAFQALDLALAQGEILGQAEQADHRGHPDAVRQGGEQEGADHERARRGIHPGEVEKDLHAPPTSPPSPPHAPGVHPDCRGRRGRTWRA